MFLKYVEEGGEKDFVFFKKLDSEFNKVNAFYRKKGFRPAHLEILFYVKINVVTLETPVSTLRGLLLASNHDHLSFSKKELWKVTARNASKEYLKVVGISYFGNTDEVNRLMDKVESAFIKHFGNGNRRKGMTADWLLTCSHCDPYENMYFWNHLKSTTPLYLASTKEKNWGIEKSFFLLLALQY
ncbi:hypothetical protein JHK87_035365 [Glycine soja]|nr:hypothetical protein JHK87_035365 [Glycine soja]